MKSKNKRSSFLSMKTSNKFWVTAGLVLGLGITPIKPAQAIISLPGVDDTTNDAWRTSSTVKPLDADGDNIYGTDGYQVFRSPNPGGSPTGDSSVVSLPSYATVNTLPGLSYFQGTPTFDYVDIDDPSQTGAGTVPNIESGILYEVGVFGGTTEWLDIGFSQSGTYRVGFLVDNTDFTTISPLDLTLTQTVGGGDIASYTLSERDLDADYYFFDIEADVNDVFRLSGDGDGDRGANGIGAVTFDTVVDPVSVPFEFSPSLGLMIMGGIFVFSRYAKSRKAKQEIENI